MNETTFRRRLVAALRVRGFLAEGFEVIHTTGVPDVWFAHGKAGSGWIELKIAKGRKVALTPAQCRWLNRAALRGIAAYVCVAYRGAYFLWEGAHADEVRVRGVDAPGGVAEMSIAGIAALVRRLGVGHEADTAEDGCGREVGEAEAAEEVPRPGSLDAVGQ